MELRSDASAADPYGGSRQGTTQAQARAAFLRRIGGEAVDAGQFLARADGVARDHPGLLGAVLGSVAADSGQHPGEDRTAAVLTALAAYGALAAHRPARPSEEQPSVWALDLATGSLRRIPRADAFGTPPPPRPPFRPPVGAAAGLTWISAVETGLAQHCEALLAQQSRAAAVSGPAPSTVPAIGHGQQRRPAAPPAPLDPPRRARPVAALRAHGRAPVAVLLDHDPQAVAVLPYLVQIVLVETAG
ncbi:MULTISPECIES: hypothetical protein [Kitasatospora]|uniref:Uncharacterized protein n=1 Tax=Kitasatospora setae (strain ATCC 33774 / DSM 43861 / JCM 3304 / KCC A-0304 / NBRC 14216 / KM-6054) TaxID=452652 RepID=E4N3W1_KITSK|nr:MULTISPECIES: hypothetical protein [Kitasatospora]BAJ31592.1 hypothetical protein KSE_58210 [Kitasatospora setae KM-6054]